MLPVRSQAAVLIFTLLALLRGPVSRPVETAATPAVTALQQALDVQVASATRMTAAAGIHIVDLDSGETVYAYNADEPRVIASNAKLFTTAAILDALGPGYAFETRFLMHGDVNGDVLRGDLGVVGSGDPQISGRDSGSGPRPCGSGG